MSLPPLSLDALQSFVVFSESLNFTKAAAGLHISQPALHVKIQKLANALGVTLYRRSGRGLELTPQGRRVVQMAREMDERASSLIRQIREGEHEEPVRLVAGSGAYLYLLGKGLRKFMAESKAPLVLLNASRDEAVSAVELGRAHLGVAVLDAKPANLETALLTRVGQVLVAPSRHPLAKCKIIRLSDLQGASLIVPPAGQPQRIALTHALRAAHVEWQTAVEAVGWDLTLRFVELGAGLAIVNACCTIPKALKAVPIPELPEIEYSLFHLRGANFGARAKLKATLRQWGTDWKTSKIS